MPLIVCLLLALGATEPLANTDPEQNLAAEQPSMELLEFLGSFETIDGDWIDPMTFEEQYESDSKAQDNETNDDKDSDNTTDPDSARPC